MQEEQGALPRHPAPRPRGGGAQPARRRAVGASGRRAGAPLLLCRPRAAGGRCRCVYPTSSAPAAFHDLIVDAPLSTMTDAAGTVVQAMRAARTLDVVKAEGFETHLLRVRIGGALRSAPAHARQPL